MTVIRVVQIRFADDQRTPTAAAMICRLARDVFPTIPGVLRVEALTAADHADWDLVLLVHFPDLVAVESYRRHPIHEEFVATHLRPRLGELVARNYSQ